MEFEASASLDNVGLKPEPKTRFIPRRGEDRRTIINQERSTDVSSTWTAVTNMETTISHNCEMLSKHTDIEEKDIANELPMKQNILTYAQISESKFILHYETSLPVSIKKNNKREQFENKFRFQESTIVRC